MSEVLMMLQSSQIQGGNAEGNAVYRILLVDEDLVMMECMKGFLEEGPGGFVVTTASSGDQAFLKLVDFKPDVIVLDVNLPDMNGIEILNPIQDIHPNAQLVVLTGKASPEQREMALRQGAVRFLEKPLELQGFRRLLQELGTKSRSREASNLEGGMDILDLVQMMNFCHKTTAVRFVYGSRRGTLRFEHGEAVHIDDGLVSGEKAFYNMVLFWGEGRFYTLAEDVAANLERNNWVPTERILMEAVLLRESSDAQMPPVPDPQEEPQAPADPGPAAEERAERLRNALGELMEAEGARAAMLVDQDGYVIESRVRGRSLAMDRVAAVLSANLGSTQAISRELGAGEGHLVMLEFETGTLLARLLGVHGIVAVLVDTGASLGHHRCQLLKAAPGIEAILGG